MKRRFTQTISAALPKVARANTMTAYAVLSLLTAGVGAPRAGWAGAPAPGDQQVQLLFVQNASGVAFDTAKGTMRLKNVSPSTLYFTDRPVRMAGHVHTKAEFLPMWGETPDSFIKDPPNATVSMLEPGRQDLQNVVVKLQTPRMEGNDLVYNITVIEGAPPKTGGVTAVFIDILGFWRRDMYRTAVISSMAASSAAMSANKAAESANAAAAKANAATAAPLTVVAPAPTTVVVTPSPVVSASAPAATPAGSPSTAKLAELKSLLNQGFITQAQYNQGAKKILNDQLAQLKALENEGILTQVQYDAAAKPIVMQLLSLD